MTLPEWSWSLNIYFWLTAFVIALLTMVFAGVIKEIRHRRAIRRKHQDSLEADRKTEELLQEHLSTSEKRQLDWYGYIEIKSPNLPGRIYRVPRRRGMVSVYNDGRAIMSLCLQPIEWIPSPDVCLMHKLMIEGDEEKYLKTANQFDPGYPHYLRQDRRTGRAVPNRPHGR